jgi:chromosomal replication initiation ATPase DnaA
MNVQTMIANQRAARARLWSAPAKIVAPVLKYDPPVDLVALLSRFRKVVDTRATITVEDIIRDVCERRDVSRDDLLSPRRQTNVVRARQEAMWLVRHKTGLSLPNIARRFGGRDHTTILHGIRTHQARLDAGVAQ